MNIGDLRQRITIQQASITPNTNGFEVETWTDFKTVWANVSNLFGREYYSAAQVNQESTVKFTIRYLAGLNENMRISFNGSYYNITFIDNIKYSNKYIQINAIEVV